MTVPETLDAEVVLRVRAVVGEGPVWDERINRLVWVDIMAKAVHVLDPSSGHDRAIDLGMPVGAAALRERGGLVLALQDGFAVLDQELRNLRWVARVEEAAGTTRMNDGKADPAGRFWAGTMAFDETPGQGALYRLDPDYRLTQVVTNVTISNGLDWTLDNRQMYYIDSPIQHVDAFDYDLASGALGNRRHVLSIPKEVGLPDGMTLDAEGGLWVALHGAGKVHRYLADGRLDRVVAVPARMVTSATFGGPDFADLYITSMTSGMSVEALEAEPLAGSVFRCRPGVRGRAPFRFAG
ncbi:MAG: SMP-30/gluconolactonase/LRE family protein [Chloroflexota bacterium]|nr:SMP-30/gluconolactonase/LRE family protein [Chloroflexota bacterium]